MAKIILSIINGTVITYLLGVFVCLDFNWIVTSTSKYDRVGVILLWIMLCVFSWGVSEFIEENKK